jgi:DNA-binding CsgD family transcriptional regulator/PAS domain-containing protein
MQRLPDWPESRIRETAEAILAAGVHPTLWPEVVSRLAESLPGLRAVMLLIHEHRADGQACSGVIQHGLEPALMRDYERHYSRINPWVPLMQRQPLLHPGVTNDHLPWQRIAHTEFFNDFLEKVGESECAAGIKLFDGHDRSAFLSFQYGSAAAERFDPLLGPLLRQLAPAFRAAIALNCAVAEGAAAVAGEAFEALSLPALVIDERGLVRSANALAGAALEQGRMLRRDAANRLRLCDRAAGERLRRALRQLRQAGCAGPGEIALRSADGERAAILSLLPVGGTAPGAARLGVLFPPERLMLAVLRDDTRRPAVPQGALCELFGLTPAEARLAARLARGESLDGAARALGIARETARVHLRQTFAKTGTRRQAQLVALIAGLARLG